MRVRESSQDTYASDIHTYIKFWRDMGGRGLQDILPEGNTGVTTADVHLFLGWAMSRYKYNTISSTVSALIDWHKMKQIPYDALNCKATKELLNTIKCEQGPEGMPVGKTGMSKPVLRLLLKHLHNRSATETHMQPLFLRDSCWILLGFFGMLRRSELIALQLQDVQVAQQANGQWFIEIRIRRSKNDRRGEGAIVTITGVSKDGIKIAERLQAWLALRKGAKPTASLFTTWDLDTMDVSNLPIRTAEALNKRLKVYLCDLVTKYPELPVNPSSYGMHSLRRGGVMAAWHAGVDVEKIKAHRRWKSDAIRAYMQTTRDMRLHVTAHM